MEACNAVIYIEVDMLDVEMSERDALTISLQVWLIIELVPMQLTLELWAAILGDIGASLISIDDESWEVLKRYLEVRIRDKPVVSVKCVFDIIVKIGMEIELKLKCMVFVN